MNPFSGFDLSARLQQRMGIVLAALNQEFGWNLPTEGSVLPGHVIGGHANVLFTRLGSPKAFQELIEEPGDTIFPPGRRLAIRLPGIKGVWGLHIPRCSIAADHVMGHAHIDRGDPDRDLAGICTHIVVDGFMGHFITRDLDPR